MKDPQPEISIVTPSFNMLPYLKLCCASVNDQEIPHEHIVMDGGSTDGTVEWLRNNKSVVSVSEKDKGMYDALNKAIAMTSAEIVGHLNCDEQYLPGILKFVKVFFDEHPSVDFIAADFLVVDAQGEFVAFRKSFQPRWPYFFSNYLYSTTCTIFYRRKVLQACQFDISYKSIADVVFLYQLLKKGFKAVHVKKYVSVFTYSGTNLSLNPISGIEKKRFNATLPLWYRMMKPLFFMLFFAERILHNTYQEKETLTYSIFKRENDQQRVTITKQNPGFRMKLKFSNPGESAI